LTSPYRLKHLKCISCHEFFPELVVFYNPSTVYIPSLHQFCVVYTSWMMFVMCVMGFRLQRLGLYWWQ